MSRMVACVELNLVHVQYVDVQDQRTFTLKGYANEFRQNGGSEAKNADTPANTFQNRFPIKNSHILASIYSFLL